jgi:mono/diheme cytochrome c family protein
MRLFLGLSVFLIAAAAFDRSGARAAEFSYDGEIRPLLDTYCFSCHGAEKPKGGLDLSAFKDTGAMHRDPKTWENVLQQIRDREMPPKNKPQPSDGERNQLGEWLAHLLANPDPDAIPKDPGRKLIHRLSHAEYNNTIRDLLGVETRVADRFPSDGGGGGGFDHNAETLFVPPILMEKYLEAADEVLNAAAPEQVFLTSRHNGSTDLAAARQIIHHHATRAFRRPVAADEVERLMALYQRSLERGLSHDEGVRTALKAVLVSPHFLFRVEVDRNATEPYRISDYELASRLSYFLWSSMPDDELFNLAGAGRLNDPGILEQQVRRMIADPKARAFSENFVGQWLRVRDLRTSARPDPRRYPDYDSDLLAAMYQEPIEFFHSVLQNDGSLLQLLDADYTYVNAALARLYGIEGVEGDAFQKVSLPDRNRGGVLTMGATLTLTSYPLRTSPVLRGKWILEEILGTPPPPPPPLIASLPPDDRPKDGLTFRQRLEKHRQDPNCASCHNRLDPLGFALENFDAIGRWRSEIGELAVDASAEMSTGEKFTGPAELKQVLLQRKQQFLRNFTERLLAYALGRGLEYYDIPAVKEMVEDLATEEYASTRLILSIVRSYPFQYRRNEPVELSQSTL